MVLYNVLTAGRTSYGASHLVSHPGCDYFSQNFFFPSFFSPPFPSNRWIHRWTSESRTMEKSPAANNHGDSSCKLDCAERGLIAPLWRICVCHLQYNCCDRIRVSLSTNGSLQLNWAQGCLGWADQSIDCHELTFMLCSPFSIIGWSHFTSSTQTQCADDQRDPTWLIYRRDHNGRTDLSEVHQIFPHLQHNHQFYSNTGTGSLQWAPASCQTFSCLLYANKDPLILNENDPFADWTQLSALYAASLVWFLFI